RRSGGSPHRARARPAGGHGGDAGAPRRAELWRPAGGAPPVGHQHRAPRLREPAVAPAQRQRTSPRERPMTDLSQAAKAAEQAAYAAGTHLMASRSRLAEVLITHKRPRDVVDEIDEEAADLIRGVLRKRFPDHGFLGDPGGAPISDGRPLWIVD